VDGKDERRQGVELSNGIDFEAWNATVRSLSSAVDRLERSARAFAAPPWMERLLEALEELNLRLEQLERDARAEPQERSPEPPEPITSACTGITLDSAPLGGSIPDPQPVPEPWEDPESAVDGLDEESSDGELEEHEPPSVSIPVRFGDPAAIAAYGRPRRR
jgi:hypothetical protein